MNFDNKHISSSAIFVADITQQDIIRTMHRVYFDDKHERIRRTSGLVRFTHKIYSNITYNCEIRKISNNDKYNHILLFNLYSNGICIFFCYNKILIGDIGVVELNNMITSMREQWIENIPHMIEIIWNKT